MNTMQAQALKERLQDVVVVVSQVNVNVERRDPFHALEMTPQCAEELPLRLVSAVLWQRITCDQHEPWPFKLDDFDQVIPFAGHLVQSAGEDYFHRVGFVA